MFKKHEIMFLMHVVSGWDENKDIVHYRNKYGMMARLDEELILIESEEQKTKGDKKAE